MSKIIRSRLHQGHRTIKYPKAAPPALPEPYRGSPVFDPAACLAGCRACVTACPTGAITLEPPLAARIDLGRCLFCTDCASACPAGLISHSRDWRQASRSRDGLVVAAQDGQVALAEELDRRLKRLFGRSLKLRQVSAGGCNACEADVNVLNTVGWDLSRFGIQLVASPRHADGLLITGPVTRNMVLALRKTYDAVAEPKLVIAVGACAISGGSFAGLPDCTDGVASHLGVDLFIPGCPPHPLTILDGLLRLLGRLEGQAGTSPA